MAIRNLRVLTISCSRRRYQKKRSNGPCLPFVSLVKRDFKRGALVFFFPFTLVAKYRTLEMESMIKFLSDMHVRIKGDAIFVYFMGSKSYVKMF